VVTVAELKFSFKKYCVAVFKALFHSSQALTASLRVGFCEVEKSLKSVSIYLIVLLKSIG
jgi:hypothetical protein